MKAWEWVVIGLVIYVVLMLLVLWWWSKLPFYGDGN